MARSSRGPGGFINLPSNTGGPSTETIEGLPDGMNLALPPQSIPDSAARYLQDILLDQPGFIRRRGPLDNTVEGFPTTAYKGSGVVFAQDPQGNNRLGVLNGDASHGQLSFLNSAFTGIQGNYTWNGFLPTNPPNSPYYITDAKAALNNGLWIGTSSQYNANAPTQSLGLWRGGIYPDYTTGTVTVARGSTTVTGSGTSWLANVSPGMFLFATTDDGYTLTFMGYVKQVVSDTSITLASASPYPVTALAYKLTSIRGFEPRVVVGRITCATSGTAVTGGNTKFTTQLLAGGTYNVYRASDKTWIGKVSSVTNDTSLTLAANAAINMDNQSYVILRADGDWGINTLSASTTKPGFLNATYAERQWFANNGQSAPQTSRVYFSEPTGPEDVDFSSFDGNYVDVTSTSELNVPITGICPAYNALLIFKENESFGIFGNTPSTFDLQKIEDDGALSAGSIQSYGGGALWAGRGGIYFYDGVQSTNLVAETFGNWWKELVRVIDPTKYRMWSAIARDHYLLFLEFCNPTVPVIKGITSTQNTYVTVAINMISRAPTLFTNFAIRGAAQLPASTGLETVFLANSSTAGNLFSSKHVFGDTGADSITCDVASHPGPDFYLETKKYSMGDSLILKLWSQLLVNYQCSKDAINIDTVVGLNNVGSTVTTNLPPTIYTWDTLAQLYPTWDALAAAVPDWDAIVATVFKPKRARFLKRSQHFAFRLWQNSASTDKVVIGPFQLGFKPMRAGRI